MKSTILWDITPCNPLKVNKRFGGIYHLQLQGRISRARSGILLYSLDPEDGGDVSLTNNA
jgi:hypothetical protein